ncbi:hypothetical protein BHE74_00027280 [Ensete ventricosum]|nr:hypothetical protein BHE74_00027280 [Ensete ventricosum]
MPLHTFWVTLQVMTILSASLGWAAPNLVSCSRYKNHYFCNFKLLLLICIPFIVTLIGRLKLEAKKEILRFQCFKQAVAWKRLECCKCFCHDQVRDDLKKHQRPFLTQFFSPVFLKVIVLVTRLKLIKKINVLFCHANCPATLITQAFSITFFGEWGDKSQVTLNVDLLRLFGCSGQAFCTTAAVLGGKSLASQISEKMVSSCPHFSIIPEMFQNTTLSFGSLMHSLIRLIGCTLQRRTFHNIWSAFLSISNRRRVMNPA